MTRWPHVTEMVRFLFENSSFFDESCAHGFLINLRARRFSRYSVFREPVASGKATQKATEKSTSLVSSFRRVYLFCTLYFFSPLFVVRSAPFTARLTELLSTVSVKLLIKYRYNYYKVDTSSDRCSVARPHTDTYTQYAHTVSRYLSHDSIKTRTVISAACVRSVLSTVVRKNGWVLDIRHGVRWQNYT